MQNGDYVNIKIDEMIMMIAIVVGIEWRMSI